MANIKAQRTLKFAIKKELMIYLQAFPRASIPHIAKQFKMPKSTLYDYLREILKEYTLEGVFKKVKNA